MITSDIIRYFEESIKVENNLSELYLLFSQTYLEDREFWWTLSLEEKNHAALIESEKLFYKVHAFPDELFSLDLDELIKLNGTLNSKIEHFKINQTRENAFKTALELENSALEHHYQEIVESNSNDRAVQLFKQLNRADKDHAK